MLFYPIPSVMRHCFHVEVVRKKEKVINGVVLNVFPICGVRDASEM